MAGDGRLFSRTTQAIVYNWKPDPVQVMLDFDYLCKRELPSIAALVHPGTSKGNTKAFFGTAEMILPVYGSTQDAANDHPNADVFINYASFRSAYASSMAALNIESIKTVVIIAEGVPISDVRRLIASAKAKGKVIIGPATVGGIQAGSFKIGDAAGTIDNCISCKLYRPGCVGFVSKSGGLSNECYNILSRKTSGLYEGIAIGGDVYSGSTFIDHILRFQKMDDVKMIVVLGELGGDNEYGIVDAMKSGQITKPVVAWVSGTCAKMFKTEVQFGHAGAKSGGDDNESAEAKQKALRDAGAIVPNSFEEFSGAIETTYKKLVADGIVVEKEEAPPPNVPINYSNAVQDGRVRRSTGIVSTICDDRGEEPTYAGIEISEMIENDYGIGDVLSLLWFKRKLPRYATKYIEMVLVLVADHGPCVSGAHNTIVAARAGKDLVSCLASGLLTIGPRFGGAIDDAARHFKRAVDASMEADQFAEDMKKKGIRIPGIGHRIKSANNLDKRVVLMKEYAKKNFPSTRHLDFALQVEQYTLKKAANLVLNVDGCIGALFLDLMESCAAFTNDEMDEIVKIGYLNGLFVLGRSIGLIGHALDQKRLNQPLYRHPWDDVMYM
eukprot:CAMPEP_0114629458 /NCGR_PEP_ID=MMETSP0168-20121206/13369_1 /TAXON_ID=95228 ORGANISM="Vannella sp., Strain DIVA3 517/6/12" /NCGR_SAMPLE_ID=MMETSP0168 /ASSEMBLY_ACC=CAM_ASM_000044 /LENGTH=610 /DNA_ID=CAMNT_0001840917 /DNA_START=60 /DNA_END=1892 /DNA_ORIENTATION=-